MRSRIVRAARTEQQHFAEKELNARVDELLQTLARHIAVCAPQWAAQVCSSSRKESTDHISGAAALAWEGWRDAELADVLSTMTEVQELVDRHVVRQLDAAAAILSGGADVMGDSLTAPTAPTSDTAAVPPVSVRFYTSFVRLLIARIFVSVTTTALSYREPPAHVRCKLGAAGPAEGDAAIVACFAPEHSASLFSAMSMLRLPASVYIGWRCGYRLLASIGDMLCVADGDRAAGWLDVTSAALRSVIEGAHARGSSFSTASAPDAAVAFHRFVASAEAHTRSLHCVWWWCSLVFEHCYAHGCLTTPPLEPSLNSALSTPESTSALPGSTTITAATEAGGCVSSGGASLPIFDADRDNYRTLWDVGRLKAMTYLNGVVLSTVADFLHAALERFVFFEAVSSPQHWSSQSEQLTKAVHAVRSVAERLFPSPAPTTDASPTATSSSRRVPLAAAAASFLRHAVHDALLPLAERVLDDPAALQGRIAPTAGKTSIAAAAAASTRAHDGWSSTDEEEWEELPLTGGASCCPSSVEAAATIAAPATAPQSTLIYALDALERELDEVVRNDSVVMTLRRL
ncbi:hypothetical protein JIQ42_04368 [Leishmania sp. Namibia]|uniref:hypothetical protein n=1 Tax=Leishmania sp. Namibia TaxID=2802991 RepID=UPI001B736026|nr:hypothetical protein JIQ42_04368 [Leishmania sp. Namibia]